MNQSHGFTRHGEELFVAQFSDSEKEVLINLSQQIIELLAERVDHCLRRWRRRRRVSQIHRICFANKETSTCHVHKDNAYEQ